VSRPLAVLCAQRVGPPQRLLPADERSRHGGQHRRLRPGAGAGAGQHRIRADQAQIQLLQRGAWVDAQLVGEPSAAVLIRRHRVGLPPAAVQRGHQQLPQVLVERVGEHQGLELRLHLTVPAQLQVDLGTGGQGGEMLLRQRRPLQLRAGPWYAGQRLPVPQRERLPQPLDRRLIITLRFI
jgi:hypothetical protein